MNEWISVDERLPEGTCLVYTPNDSGGNNLHIGVYHDNINTIGNHFEFDMDPVTHWQPLPEPPK